MADGGPATGTNHGRAAGAVLVAAAAVYLVSLGDRAVVSEEVRWAEVAREMRQSGDYLRPTINGTTYFDKPVGSYWLIVAASYPLGEVNETAARLPAALAGVIGVGVVMLLGRQLYDARTAVYAGAVLATCYGYAFYARRATADVETVTGVLLAVWWFARHEDRPTGPWVVVLWLGMAAVSLTKGLLGFALPVAVLGAYGLWSAWAERPAVARGWAAAVAHHNRWFFNRWTLLGVPLAAAAYLLPFVLATDSSAGLGMVWRENVKRFVNPHNHRGPVYLYVGAIFVLAAPWAAFLPAALVPPPTATRGDRLARAYFVALFLFFTASASRRSYYLLPVLPAVALLVARVLVTAELSTLARRLHAAAWGVLAAGVVLGGAALVPPAWLSPELLLPPLPYRGALVAAWLLAVAAVAVALVRPTVPRAAWAAAGLFLGFAFAFGFVLPATEEFRPRRDFLKTVRERTDADPARLALHHTSDIVFDLGRITPEYATPGELAAAVAAGKVRWVVMPRRLLPDLQLPAETLAEEAMLPWESPERVENKLVLVAVGGG